MKYYQTHNIAFIHIPKTAGGSIATLLRNKLGAPIIFDNEAHCTLDRVISRLNTDTKIFTSLRNPYDAAVSLYCSHRSANVFDILDSKDDWAQALVAPARTLSFDQWLEQFYIKNRPPYKKYLLVNGVLDARIKFVKYENLFEDLNFVLNDCYKLNIDVNTIPHVHKSERTDESYLTYYTKRSSIEIINNKYKWTFDMGFYKKL